ncbi:DUF4011 domain-containing protein [Mycoplasma sp. CSL10137]|uniref:DUF4011 domain-containing protein n=1 Tax=Mycoplasma sp. CSL10137 TaxID=2813824 RepID=UPI00197BF098|nr:DUF4011 domain-containing protein [Mycoplasma sp. CSL10137]MBN4083289.1 DUF4011 domain-containing protein [Mycoplasma sp. CSL10137]
MNNKILENLKIWKNSLLDLTLRNKALNFNIFSEKNKIGLPFISPNLKIFLNETANYKNIDIENLDLKKMNLTSIDSKIDLDILLKHNINVNNKKSIYSSVNGKEQTDRLKKLYKNYISFQEEFAINTLFVSVGYLKWFENLEDDKEHFAPLMLISTNLKEENKNKKRIYQLNFDDESILQPNETLLQKLETAYKIKIDISVLDNELDNYSKYIKFKELISSKFNDPRWEIIDQLYLSVFNFSKINMHKDLEENEDKIVLNNFIKSISGDDQNIEFEKIDETNIEEKFKSNELYHVLDADSSQEIAIQKAIQGQSFILQGPPGTGKSHTITNIISELLARGKKILFVSEKKAALDVVYNNLKKIGLESYSIPIHNEDLDKKVILNELYKSLEKGNKNINIINSQIENIITKYSNSSNFLNNYGRELLLKREPIKMNLYHMISNYYNLEKYDDVYFKIDNFNNLNLEQVEKISNLLIEFEERMNFFDKNPFVNSWWGLKWNSYSELEKEEILSLIYSVNSKISNIDNLLIQEHKDFTFNKEKFAFNIELITDIFKRIIDFKNKYQLKIDINAFTKDLNIEIDLYQKIFDESSKIDTLKSKLDTLYNLEKINLFDFNKVKNIYLDNKNKFFKFLNSKWRSIIKDINSFSKESKANLELFEDNINYIIEYKDRKKTIEECASKLNYRINDYKTDNIKQTLDMLVLVSFIKEQEKNSNFRINIQNFIMMVNDDFGYIKNLNTWIMDNNQWIQNINSLQNLFKSDILNLKNLNKKDLESKLDKLISDQPYIRSITELNNNIIELKNNYLYDFVDKIFELKKLENYKEIFLKRLYKLLIDYHLNQTKDSYKFTNTTLEINKKEFSLIDEEIKKIAKIKTDAKLLSQIPSMEGIGASNPEIKILKAEANKSRRIMPFRKLFQKIPNLLLQLKPCLMMSPLSVSKYLSGTEINFDVVIFDEASQVRPENAIGAIYRSNQLIIVGDNEQLPPTSFFDSLNDNEEIHEEYEDENDISIKGFDSILELSNIALPTIKLRWHYRSEFDQLIYPSNYEIYDDLVTFPASRIPGRFEAIQFQKVSGIFDSGINKAEAETVINILEQIMKEKGTNISIGIVTFNIKQQMYIEGLVEKFRDKHPEYEPFFDRKAKEPLFIKNIETVQGDERDIIIISSVYGKDIKGNISMHFGPINHSNGYKRLNVAFTRAKKGVILVSSLSWTDIDLERSSSRGIKFFKDYLKIAEFGINNEIINLENDINKSGFEDELYNELTNKGFKIKKHIGNSDFKVDLAVLDPNNENNYLLGIEIDAESYNWAKTTRDRDKLRQQILKNRGWNIYRVWSVDWFRNKSQQLQKLLDAIESAINSNQNKNINEDINEALMNKPNIIREDYSETIQERADEENSKVNNISQNIDKNYDTINQYFIVEEREPEEIEFNIWPNFDFNTINNMLYELFDGNKELLYKTLIKQYKIIHEKQLQNIFKYSFNTSTFSKRIREVYDAVINRFKNEGFIRIEKGYDDTLDNNFIVLNETDTDEILFYGYNEENKRKSNEISVYEYKDIILKIIKQIHFIDRGSLHKKLLEYIGYKSTNLQTSRIFNYVLEKMINENLIKFNEDANIYSLIE